MKKNFKNKMKESASLVILIGIIILLNVVLSFVFFRIDLTEDQRYTISPVTVDYLKNNENFNKTRVHFKVYLAGELPADLKIIKNGVQEKLDEFKIYAGNKITYEFIDPDGSDDEEFNQKIKEQIHAESEGLWPTDIEIYESGEVSLKTVWGGAEILINGVIKERLHFFTPGRTYTVNDLKNIANNALNDLEFTLISNIKKAVQPKKKRIGFLRGHGELRKQSTEYIRAGLQTMYQVEEVTIDGQINALRDFDALIVAQPSERFNEKDKFIIDQFIMKGGSVAWFIDLLDVNRDSLFYRGKTFGLTQPLNLEDQLFKYGVRINPDLIIDETCSPIYVPGHPKGVLPWYFYPRIKPENNHPITKNIDPVKTEYVSSIDLVGKGDLKKDILLKTSPKSGKYGTPVRIDYRMVDTKPNFNQMGSKNQGYPVAVMVEGEFESLYKNRLTPDMEKAKGISFREKSISTKMLIVSDGDVIRNEVDSIQKKGEWLYRPFPMEYDPNELRAMNMKGGEQQNLQYMYGNYNFILNAIDYMIDSDNLLEVRTKSISLRMLNKEKIKEERSYWKTVNLILPLLLIGLVGIIMTFNRRKKYSS